MKTSIIRALAATALLTTLAGCAFAPPANPPAPPSPAHYAVQTTPTQTAAAVGLAQHFSLGARALPEWWRLYGNDSLNAWVDEGLRNNPSLAATPLTREAVP